MDIKPLLKEACTRVFGDAGGIVDMLSRHIPSAVRGTPTKVTGNYTGPQDTELADAIRKGAPTSRTGIGPLWSAAALWAASCIGEAPCSMRSARTSRHPWSPPMLSEAFCTRAPTFEAARHRQTW